MSELNKFQTYYTENKEKILKDYFDLLRFPSITTDPDYQEGVQNCANFLVDHLRKIGLTIEKWETKNAPVIFATTPTDDQLQTLLIYVHYDVQPVDPLEEWISPPFEPTIRDNAVYARGSLDDKGQCFYTIAAIEALLKIKGKLPVNLKLLIEGEEESGSFGLSQLLEEKKECLKADYLLIVDSGLVDQDTPAITLGARGILCMEINLQEANLDVHSGMLGGIAFNPNRAMADLLAKLHNSKGTVAVPGFYDEVVEMQPNERKEISFDFDEEKFEKFFGFKPTAMESGLSPYESAWLRPTLEINGMGGGYTGQGFKTVIPAKSQAKISCRLVPRQNPDQIAKLVQNYVESQIPPGIKAEVKVFSGSGKGFRTNADSRIVKIMSESYAEVFNKPCQKILIGGSIPIAVDLAETAQAEMVLVGVGIAEDQIHAPNEHFGLDRFEKGFLTICRGIELFS